MIERPDWDSYFIEITQAVAKRADCRRRQVGCVIVGSDRRIISTGYNGAPAGDVGCLEGACPRGLLSYDEVQEFTDYDSGPGRCISLHAEANALLYAGKLVRGGTAYVTAKPCPTCSKLLIAAGIDRVVYMGDGVERDLYFRPPGYIKRKDDPRFGPCENKDQTSSDDHRCTKPKIHMDSENVGDHMHSDGVRQWFD